MKILWDSVDWGVFIACEADCQRLYTYVYVPNSLNGPVVNQTKSLKLEKSGKFFPIVVLNGVVTAQVFKVTYPIDFRPKMGQ